MVKILKHLEPENFSFQSNLQGPIYENKHYDPYFNWSGRTEESHICSQTNNEKCIFVSIYAWCYFKAQQCSIHQAETLQIFFIHLAPLRCTLGMNPVLQCGSVICLLSHSSVFIQSEGLEFSLLCSSSLLSQGKKANQQFYVEEQEHVWKTRTSNFFPGLFQGVMCTTAKKIAVRPF